MSLAGALPRVALADALLDQARTLIDARQARSAFALLAPNEAARAGEVEFDYLLGIAALDAGDAQRAVFALERVLATDPRHLQARAEIARALLTLGERRTGEAELRTVRADPRTPREVLATLDRFLAALAPVTTRLSAFVEASYGFDTNTNSATAQNQIAIPALGGAIGTLLPNAVRRRDSFIGEAIGVGLTHDLAPSVALIASASQSGKFNRHADAFDITTLDASAGLRFRAGAHALSLVAQSQSLALDNSRFRDSAGGVAQWQWTLDPRTQMSVYYQQARLAYPSQRVRDTDRGVAGVALARAFAVRYEPIAFATLYGGHERERDRDFAYLGSGLAGIRVGIEAAVAARVSAFANVAYERRTHRGEDPVFLSTRRDVQADYRIGASVTLPAYWRFVAQIIRTENDSNIDLNDYARTVYSVALRRQW